ncbi:MAG: hypothetical protein C4534_03880 [Gaiellales bacterium]|nr:MAG: hypothetical protein C4534_03880 [Gaiellales bacterium]
MMNNARLRVSSVTALSVVLLLTSISLFAALAGCGEETAAGNDACADCHADVTPGIVEQWRDSRHGDQDVGCLDCHQAAAEDADAFEHNGETIAIIVSPADCANCHIDEVEQFSGSHHAQAAQFTGSLDNFLGVAVEGYPAAVQGCQQCHGGTVTVTENGQLDPETWPNTGMGRVNPDGSMGSCSACHARHEFSRAQAREPESCGKCHVGPDHPQLEVFMESKHGILYEANREEMNLESDSWVVGEDYSAAPTCATCHMSATPGQETTHDIGTRISWTLRPVVSKKFDNWEEKRASMVDVCTQCHSSSYVGDFYSQFDNSVELYNNKFAIPAKAIMEELQADGLVSATPFDDKIEWTYFELWHHEGRRARHGAAMAGPDYVQWLGFYEVADNFYNQFLPEAEALKPGISQQVLAEDYHKWRQGLSEEEMQQLLQFYEERYDQ